MGGELQQYAVTDAPNEKGGAPVSVAAQFQDMTMLNVAESPMQGKTKGAAVARFHTVSGTRSAAIWLDEQVKASANGVTTQIVDLTPDLAKAMLERNPENRRLSEAMVESFARDIKAGHWPFNGESVIVSSDGKLNDGQHRCAAVVVAHAPIKVVLVIGAERETRTTLDQGKNRLISDYLSMEGHVGAPILASAAFIAWQVEKYGFTTRSRDFRATKSELMGYVDAHGGLIKAVARIPQYGVRKIGGRPVLAFCLWHLTKWSNAHDAENFIETLIAGTDLNRGNPILYVRNRLMQVTGMSVADRVELILRGWNAHRRGETVTRIPLAGGKLPDLEA